MFPQLRYNTGNFIPGYNLSTLYNRFHSNADFAFVPILCSPFTYLPHVKPYIIPNFRSA
jgi:hypothetical protein